MSLTFEAVFTLVGVLVALPALLVLLFNLWRRWLRTKSQHQGMLSTQDSNFLGRFFSCPHRL